MDLLRFDLTDGPPRVLHVSGEIDLATAEEFQSVLEDVLSTGPAIVDMAGVTFIDASGLRVILRVGAALNGTGPLRLVNAEHVERLFDVVGMGALSSVDFRAVA